uniref:GH16 domain-containing protein n=1 Tax=Bionectria ochroleuca TaxID=29856 RepID=A0A8H7K4U5_BIOOC
MIAKSFFAAAALALSVSAQTSTTCNPLERDCPAAPALGNQQFYYEFKNGDSADFNNLGGTNFSYDANNGALFNIDREGQSPTIALKKYIFFGRIDVELQASPGVGVVTSVVLQSADLDEIDWEWLGGDNTQVQSNYFGKGDVSTYDRGAFHPVSAPVDTFHTYSIDWTAQKVDWLIDNVVVRTLSYADAKGGSRYPQTPMEVKLGTWVAGLPSASPGTVQWAGGMTDFSKAPFDAWYKSIKIVDYAGGSAPTTDNVKEYVFGDRSGSFGSIQIVKN